jgi:hypothetical protein
VVAGGAVMASQLAEGDHRGATGTAVGMGGALAGAQMGAVAGAVAGPVGAVVGGFAGGVAGFMAGTEVGQRAYDAITDSTARQERQERAQVNRQNLRGRGVQRIEGWDDDETPTPQTPEAQAQAAARAAVAGMTTPVGGAERVEPGHRPSSANVARAEGHAADAARVPG